MSDGTHVGARFPDALVEALDEVAAQGRTSRSEVLREAVRDHVLEGDDVDLPDHIEREVRRDELKRRNKLKWQRIHFPSNYADRIRRAFEQGDLDSDLNPGAVDEIREIHVEDAELLFEDDDERRESVIEFVNAVADHAQESSDVSEFNRLDPEEMFSRYAGVEEAREEARVEPVRDRAREMIARDVDARDVVSRLGSEFDLTPQEARDVYNEVADEEVDRR